MGAGRPFREEYFHKKAPRQGEYLVVDAQEE